MNRQQQIEFYQKLDAKLIEVSKSKGEDYASEDVLSNFKKVSAAAQALDLDVGNPVHYAMFMSILKIARITNLMKGNKTPNNESLTDSFEDGINYFKLAYATYVDG